MKTDLEIAVSYKEVTKKTFTIDLPETDVFFYTGSLDDSDCQLFAICLYGDNKQSGHYNLMWVKGNGEHTTTDFIPRKDMQDSYWVDGQGFRKLALDLIRGQKLSWNKTTKEVFITQRAYIMQRSINKLFRHE